MSVKKCTAEVNQWKNYHQATVYVFPERNVKFPRIKKIRPTGNDLRDGFLLFYGVSLSGGVTLNTKPRGRIPYENDRQRKRHCRLHRSAAERRTGRGNHRAIISQRIPQRHSDEKPSEWRCFFVEPMKFFL